MIFSLFFVLKHSPRQGVLRLCQAGTPGPDASSCSLVLYLRERRFTLEIIRGGTVGGVGALRSEGKMTKDVNNGKVGLDRV